MGLNPEKDKERAEMGGKRDLHKTPDRESLSTSRYPKKTIKRPRTVSTRLRVGTYGRAKTGVRAGHRSRKGCPFPWPMEAEEGKTVMSKGLLKWSHRGRPEIRGEDDVIGERKQTQRVQFETEKRV